MPIATQPWHKENTQFPVFCWTKSSSVFMQNLLPCLKNVSVRCSNGNVTFSRTQPSCNFRAAYLCYPGCNFDVVPLFPLSCSFDGRWGGWKPKSTETSNKSNCIFDLCLKETGQLMGLWCGMACIRHFFVLSLCLSIREWNTLVFHLSGWYFLTDSLKNEGNGVVQHGCPVPSWLRDWFRQVFLSCFTVWAIWTQWQARGGHAHRLMLSTIRGVFENSGSARNWKRSKTRFLRF